MKSNPVSLPLSTELSGKRTKWVTLMWVALFSLPAFGGSAVQMQQARALAPEAGERTAPSVFGIFFTVNSTADGVDAAPGNGVCETATGNNVCTLRAAIGEANAHAGDDGIGFSLPVPSTINLTSPLPNLSSNIDIEGPGADKLSVSGANAFRVFNVTTTGTVTFFGLTIRNGFTFDENGAGILKSSSGTVNVANCMITGNSATFSGGGGGIFNTGGGTLNVTNSTLSANSASNFSGGGISTFSGTVNVTNCTITGNSAIETGAGGGIFKSDNAGTVNVTNCTITGNSADGDGGGIANVFTGQVNVKSSIIANNTASTSAPDVSGTFISQGFNLIGKNDGAAASFPAGNPNANNDIVGTSASSVDPKLDPTGLQNNGGPTQTVALLIGSPAIDKGTSNGLTGTLIVDQRGLGYARTVDDPSVPNTSGGDGADVGAFEFGAHIIAGSRKTHGSSDMHDIDLPLIGPTTGVECRRNTSADTSGPNVGRDHEVIITFPRAVTVGGVSVTSSNTADTPTATSIVSSNIVTVDLHNVPNARTLTVKLTNVSDGTNTNNVSIPMGVLLGDVNGDSFVLSGDYTAVRQKSGVSVDSNTFQFDINVDGFILSGDYTTARQQSGAHL